MLRSIVFNIFVNVCVRYEGTKSQKVTLGASKFCSKSVCAEIFSKRVIKNEPKETYSIVRKRTKMRDK